MAKTRNVFKHIGFYLFQCTWGLPLTLVGSIGALFMLITGHKPKKIGYFIQFTARRNGGWGFEGGIFIFTSKDCEFNGGLIIHEMGHCSYQQLWFGPLNIFIVTIPSTIRYWYRNVLYIHNRLKYNTLPPYDAIWFEKTATEYGKKFYAKMLADSILKEPLFWPNIK